MAAFQRSPLGKALRQIAIARHQGGPARCPSFKHRHGQAFTERRQDYEARACEQLRLLLAKHRPKEFGTAVAEGFKEREAEVSAAPKKAPAARKPAVRKPAAKRPAAKKPAVKKS